MRTFWKPTACVGTIAVLATLAATGASPSAAAPTNALAKALTKAPASTASSVDQPTSAAPATTRNPLADRIIVVWRQGTDSTDRAEARDAADTTSVQRLGSARFQVVKAKPGQSTADAIAALKADPNVSSVDRDGFYYLDSVPNDPGFDQLWGQLNTGAGIQGAPATAGADADVVPAWDRTVGTSTTVVADLDSGYDFVGPELGPVAWSNPLDPNGGGDDDGNGLTDDYRGWDFVGPNADVGYAGDNNPTDDDLYTGGHGLHTAGTIGAKGDNGVGVTGVAQNVRIMPLRICAYSPANQRASCPFSSTVAAILYAGAHGARAANMSIGGTSFHQPMLDALAASPGTLYVISAGNDMQNNETTPHYPCNYNPDTQTAVPTAIDNVVCVAASNQQDNPASFTDWGLTAVDLAAPGTEILSTYVGTTTLWSDSFSSANFSTNWNVTSGSWGRAASGDGPLSSFGMSDSPATNPAIGSVTSTLAGTVPANSGACHVEMLRFIREGGVSDFSYTVLLNGSPFGTFNPADTAGTAMEFRTTAPFNAQGATVAVRFDLTGAPSGASNGVWLDDVKVVCNNAPGSPAGYAYLQGTSMAAPHVTGAAALLFSLKPSATVTEVRNALLGSVEPLPATWAAKPVATGGRLDVAAALGRLVPPNTVFKSKPAATSPNQVKFTFGRESVAKATYKCKLDSGAFASCTASKTFKNLSVATHTVQVFATDLYGNVDSSPASYTWKVVPCVVPKVKGKSLANATTALNKAGCLRGKLTKPRGVALDKLKVKSSTPGKGTHKPSGFKVKLTLVKK